MTTALGGLAGLLIGGTLARRFPAGTVTPRSTPTATSLTAEPPPSPSPSSPERSPAPVDQDDLVERARVLAEQPDVRGLIALREEAVRSAEQEGTADSEPMKQRIAEIDRSLARARALRLTLDREELLKAGDKAKPPAGKIP